MTPNSETLSALDENGCGLRITFVWHRDRFAHNIAAVDGNHVVPLLASEEGTDQNYWPPSPPLQNLTIEHRGEQQNVALLVGMAGTSHWSLSIEAHPDTQSFVFDAACRVKSEAGRLVSGYRSMIELSHLESRAVFLKPSGLPCRVQVGQVDGISMPAIEPTPSGLRITAPFDAKEAPCTIRWKYVVARIAP